jgi:hypothetical protein
MVHKSFIPNPTATDKVAANINKQCTVLLGEVVITNFIILLIMLKIKKSNLFIMNIFHEWLK